MSVERPRMVIYPIDFGAAVATDVSNVTVVDLYQKWFDDRYLPVKGFEDIYNRSIRRFVRPIKQAISIQELYRSMHHNRFTGAY